ncbi:MAG: VCBS repeat-containing protein [Nitrospirae bacterium]|nr:VCBS repeat-containing protein [Nitrospirota bacterium]
MARQSVVAWKKTVVLGFLLFVGMAAFTALAPSTAKAASCDTAGATVPCSEDKTLDGCTQCHSMQIAGGNRSGGVATTDRYINLSASAQRHILDPRVTDWTFIIDQMILKGAVADSAKLSAYLNTNYCPSCLGPIISSPTVSGIAGDSATINWTTEVPATTCVAYGTSATSLTGDTCTASDPNYDATNATLVTSHAVVLKGLTAGLTKYYFVHRSAESGGATATYSAAQSFLTSPGGGGGGGGTVGTIISLAVGNYSADTNLDLAVSVSGKNQVIAYLGNGANGFTPGPPLANVGTSPLSITSGGVKGDFNGDGRDDLAVANFGATGTGQNVAIFLGTGTATSANPAFQSTPVTTIPLVDPPTSVVTGDFDNDGKLDLAVATVGTAGHVLIFKGDGTGGFATPPVTTLSLSVSTGPVPTITSAAVTGLPSIQCQALPLDLTIIGTNLFDGLTYFHLEDGTTLSVKSTSADSTTVIATLPSGVTAGVHTVVATLGLETGVSPPITISPRILKLNYTTSSPVAYGSAGTIYIVGGVPNSYGGTATAFAAGATVTIGPTPLGSLTGTVVAGSAPSAATPFVLINGNTIGFYWSGTELPAGTYDVSVADHDACAGGATVHNALTVYGTPPQPTITSVSPATLSYGTAVSQAIVINGTNFVAGSTITVGTLTGTTVTSPIASANVPYSYSSGGKLYFWWPNTALPVGSYTVTVANPSVTGGLSASLTGGFTVAAPQPAITSVSPATVAYGSTANQAIAINGANFVSGATITVGTLTGTTFTSTIATAAFPYSYNSSGKLYFWWPNTSLPAGTYNVTVTNPASYGGLSVTLTGGFTVETPQPAITSLTPATVSYGTTASQAILINGTNFVSGATITVGTLTGTTITSSGTANSTNPYTYYNSGGLYFWWPNTSLPVGTYNVTVTNPASVGGLSVTLTGGFTVSSSIPPQPTITSVSPATVISGITASQAIAINGTNFVSGATITVGTLTGTTVTSTIATASSPYSYNSNGKLYFWWPNTSLAAGTYDVTVTNPASVGGLSATLTGGFSVQIPQPTITNLTPATVLSGGVTASQAIAINGSNFVTGATITVGTLTGTTITSTVKANSSNPYTYYSSGLLYFWWPNTSLPIGTYNVTVTNPASAGGLSVTLTNGFTVAGPQPTITSLNPATVSYGVTASRAIAINGTNFVSGATITVGTLSGTTVTSATATASVPYSYNSSSILYFWWPNTSLPIGTYNVTVTNPASQGGLSVTLTNGFTVAAPQPTITSLNPATVSYGVTTSRAILINGTNFVTGATITVGSLTGSTVTSSGTANATLRYTYYNSGALYFWWPNMSLPVGTYNVTVTNPASVGGLSVTLTGGFVVQ